MAQSNQIIAAAIFKHQKGAGASTAYTLRRIDTNMRHARQLETHSPFGLMSLCQTVCSALSHKELVNTIVSLFLWHSAAMNTEFRECDEIKERVKACYGDWFHHLWYGSFDRANCEKETHDYRQCVQVRHPRYYA